MSEKALYHEWWCNREERVPSQKTFYYAARWQHWENPTNYCHVLHEKLGKTWCDRSSLSNYSFHSYPENKVHLNWLGAVEKQSDRVVRRAKNSSHSSQQQNGAVSEMLACGGAFFQSLFFPHTESSIKQVTPYVCYHEIGKRPEQNWLKLRSQLTFSVSFLLQF